MRGRTLWTLMVLSLPAALVAQQGAPYDPMRTAQDWDNGPDGAPKPAKASVR